jgi:hypothetical protein
VLGLLAVPVCFQVMAAAVALSRARNRSAIVRVPVIFGWEPDPYEVATAVAWLARADAAVVVLTLILAALVVVALVPATHRHRSVRRAEGGTAEVEHRREARLLTVLATAGLLALAAVFAVIAFGRVRRLSAAYDVARTWEVPAFLTDEVARPFLRMVFLAGAPSLILAVAIVTIAVMVYRRRPGGPVAAGAIGGLAAVLLLAGLSIGAATDRTPGRLVSRPVVVMADGRLQIQTRMAPASAADDLNSRLLEMSGVDTVGQVVGLLLVGLIVVALITRRRAAARPT